MMQVEIALPVQSFAGAPEMSLWTRHEHGSRPVKVFRNSDGVTRYRLGEGATATEHSSVRSLLREVQGRETSMTFDRYFRVGRHRQRGRAGGSGDILTLLGVDGTTIAVDGSVDGGRWSSPVVVSPEVAEDAAVQELLEVLNADLQHADSRIRPSQEMKDAFDQSFGLALDRLEGRVGIDLGSKSGRGGVKTRADEVRKLLWAGFAGKMLSQGYDAEDVLQEVFRGILVRDKGKCPWDARKSTFGHYVHMVCQCITTNYHRKQVRRVDRNAVSLDVDVDGERREDVGQFGSQPIWSGSDIGDRLALESLIRHLEQRPDETSEGALGRLVLSMVASGHTRQEIAKDVNVKPAMVSRALTWLRRRAAEWAIEGDLGEKVPVRYRSN
jgi:DNA-directed RNA polymerase specialized sigma24 family protein